jgi:hypothetical protein
MKNIFFILLFYFSSINLIFCQEKTDENLIFFVRDSKDSLVLSKANIILHYENGIVNTESDLYGRFSIKKTLLKGFKQIRISYVGYETITSKQLVGNEFYLTTKNNYLGEVKIKTVKRSSFIESFLPYVYNLGFSRIAVNYIPYIDKRKNVEMVKFHLVDFGGVKGLKYLPFKVNFFTVNIDTGKPDRKILMEDILIKKNNNKKWVEVDFSNLNISVPPEGIFVAFIILDRKDYVVETIESKYGIIDAVPYLKLRRTNNKSEKSYVFHPFYYEPAKEYNYWERLPAVFEIEIEYEK